MESLYDWIRQSAQLGVQAGMLPEYCKYGFVINALLCALFIGPTLGALGTLVVARRMAFFSTAIGNAAITGIAIGIMAGEPVSGPYISLFSFAILFAVYLNFSRNYSGMSNDTLIGVFLAASIAVGSSLMFYVTRDINIHLLDSFLFGSLLTAGSTDITLLAVISVVALLVCALLFNPLMLSGLDVTLAGVRGARVLHLNYLFVVLIALVTVASIKIVGAVLVEALLIIPAAAARNLCVSLGRFMALSIVFASVSAVSGIIIPIQFNLPVPSGGAIIIVAAVLFILTLLVKVGRRQ